MPIDKNYCPLVSIIIAARNEQKLIKPTIDSLKNINYPNFEIIIVDDASDDNTPSILQEYVDKNEIRVITKNLNEGKSMAINDAMMCANGDIFLVMDADAQADPEILNCLIPHFKRARVAAVAGNPRVKNTSNFLTRMQLLEYTGIISIIRRSQRIWGRIMAVSGVVFAVRKSAFFDVGGFTPAAATEDIDLTWKLQRRFWDVHYESSAIAWVHVPTTYRDFFNQRLRWSRGLMHVIHRYFGTILHWKYRRMWPVFIENVLSTIWAIAFVVLTIVWVISLFVSNFNYGTSIIPLAWGTIIATLSIILCLLGIAIDKKYDPELPRFIPYIIFYPIYYWILLAVIAVLALPALVKKPKSTSTWVSPNR